MASKVRKDDQVEVLAGKDKGKRGRVLRVLLDRDRVLVENIGMVKKHVKPNPQRNIKGGIAEQEASIHISNVMVVDSDGRKTRLGSKVEGDRKVRVSKKSGTVIASKGDK